MQYKIRCDVKHIGAVIQGIHELDGQYLPWLWNVTPDIYELALRTFRWHPASRRVSVMYTETDDTVTLTYQSAIEYLMVHVVGSEMELYYTHDITTTTYPDDDDDSSPDDDAEARLEFIDWPY